MHSLLVAFLISFAFDLGRYVVVAVPAFFVFWRWLAPGLRARWLRPEAPDRASIRREVLLSMSTALVFGAVGGLVFLGAKAHVLKLDDSPSAHGWPYFFGSIALLIVMQDAYFYVTHRAMHHRLLFRAMHLSHHLSRHTSPFTAYAFSPLEALVHAAFVPLFLLVLPAHPIALFVFLGFMIVRNVHGHLGIELFPASFTKSKLWSLSTTTTHHALHHERPGKNFGLYFTVWDRVMGTTDATYEARFERAARGHRDSRVRALPSRA
jgi:sterol desaturase/sphingolipid hydroxylase (fatty acid hydroxylase superfamily)